MKELFVNLFRMALGLCGMILVTLILCHLPDEVLTFILAASVWTFFCIKL